MTPHNLVVLRPTTARLKQLIKAHGTHWIVRRFDRVQCFNGQRALFIESADGLHGRWVLPCDVQPLKVLS